MTTTDSFSPESLTEQLYSRPATIDDLYSIVSVINHAFADENPFLLKDRVDLEEIQRLMLKGEFLLFEEAGKIVSVIYVEIREHGRGYLGLLVVDPAKRGNGVGRQMIQDGEALCRQRGCRLVEGVVINRRPDLLERYKRYGFRVVGELPGEQPLHVQGGYSLTLIEKDL
jgi:GNAT superfamily N-acetyltransferase